MLEERPEGADPVAEALEGALEREGALLVGPEVVEEVPQGDEGVFRVARDVDDLAWRGKINAIGSFYKKGANLIAYGAETT